jgi:hypothetical protein
VGAAFGVSVALLLSAAGVAQATKFWEGTTGNTTVGVTGGLFTVPRDVAANEAAVNDGNPAANGDFYVVEDTSFGPGGHRVSRLSSAGVFELAFGRDVVSTGPGNADERQAVTVAATTGTFTLTFAGQPTAAIDYNAAPGVVQTALEDLSNLEPGDVIVTGGPGDATGSIPYVVQFAGDQADVNLAPMTSSPAGLGGGTAVVSTQVEGAISFEVCVAGVDVCKGGVSSGGDGTVGGNGSFANPQGVAVDQDTGNVYVSDRNNRRINAYTPNGSFLRSFGFDVQIGGATTYEICGDDAADTGDVCKAGVGLDAGPAGQFGASTTAGGYKIDVSKPDGNPATGSVFLANTSSERVEQYQLDGTNPTNFGTTPTDFPANHPLSVAVGDGFVYATATAPFVNSDGFTVTAQVVKRYDLSTLGFSTINVGAISDTSTASPTTGLEVDRLTGHLFVSRANSSVGVLELADPAGDPSLFDTHFTNATMAFPSNVNINGIGLAGDTGTLFVASNHRVFRLDDDGVAPIDLSVSATNVGPTTAELRATIDANGPTGFPVSYHFEVSKDGSTWTQLADDQLAGPTGDDPDPVQVTTAATGLEANAFYRFRLVATRPSGAGSVTSGEGFFLTDPAAPAVSGLRINQLRDTSANPVGRVNPNNQATTYSFHYSVVGSGIEHQTPAQSAGSGGTAVPVAAQIGDLEPSSTYSYTLEAMNATGTTTSTAGTFKTLDELAPEDPCPNAAFRTGASAHLPDCRAYEMVSPIDKNGGDIETAEEEAGIGSHLSSAYRQASVAGDKITYSSATTFGDAVGGHWSNQYLSTRGSQGWSTHSISSRRGLSVLEPEGFPSSANLRWFALGYFQGFTPDLSSAWVRDDNVDTLAPGALEGYVNLYRRDNTTDAYEPLTNQGPFGAETWLWPGLSRDALSNTAGPRFLGASDDLRHQVFVVTAPLTPEAIQPPGPEQAISQLYDLVDGQLHLVSRLPDGTPNTNHSFAGTAGASQYLKTRTSAIKNAVSSDGSRIFWTSTPASGGGASPSGPGALYVRENPDQPQSATTGDVCTEPAKACTVHIAGAAASTAGAQFYAAAADGSKALYSLGDPPARTLHVFDVDSRTSTQIAGQLIGVAAAADDLSHVYFVSKQDLAAGAVAGENNLYDYHDGEFTRVAAVTDDDLARWIRSLGGSQAFGGNLIGRGLGDGPSPIVNQTRVTPDGRHFVFMSNSRALSEATAGYDNTDVVVGKPVFEVFHFDADTRDLSCVSCKPSGLRPRGGFVRAVYSPVEIDFSDNSPGVASSYPVGLRVGASIPTWEHDNYASRLLSDDGGRVFFHSDDELLSGDTNSGVQDVYEWQAEGSGGCDSSDASYSNQNNGCLSLVSTGKDGARSEFVDASPDGDDVFISTDQSLDPRDPGLRDIYVARVGGGFPAPVGAPDGCGVLEGSCQGGGVAGVAGGGTTSSPSSVANAAPGARQTLRVAPLSARARVRAARSGILSLRVRASVAGRVSVAAKARLGGKSRMVARKAVRVPKGRSATVKLRLSSAARGVLRRGRGLRLAVRVRQDGVRARTLTVTLKRGSRS